MALSTQQEAVINWVLTGKGNLVLRARAGCGKTYTLLQVVNAIITNSDANVFMGAYNTAIAAEISKKLAAMGAKFPQVVSSTMHSAGLTSWKKVAPNFKNAAGEAGKPEPNKTQILIDGIEAECRRLALNGHPKAAELTMKADLCQVTSSFVKKAVSLAKQRAFGFLCSYNDPQQWFDMIEHFGLEQDLEGEIDLDTVIKLCIKVYEKSLAMDREMIDYDDMILAPLVNKARMFQYDWVMIDEAQDTNPARRALAAKMLKPGGRFVAVGDECQPEGTKISMPSILQTKKTSLKNIEDLIVGDRVVSYNTQTTEFFKRDGKEVTGISKRWYKGDLVVVTLPDGSRSRYTPNHRVWTNFNFSRGKYVVYLMRRTLEDGSQQYRVGQSRMSYSQSIATLTRVYNEKADALWILNYTETLKEAYILEQIYSGKYGLPQNTFKVSNKSQINQDELDSVWKEIGDNSLKGLKCLKDFKLEETCPFHTNNQDPWKQSCKRPGKQFAANLVAGCTFMPFIEAPNTRSKKSHWVEGKISREPYEGWVYSLTVKDTGLYIADGITTHNCQAIYGFTGADNDSLDLIQKAFTASELPLTMTYRCPKKVVALAQTWVEDIEAHESNGEGVVRTINYLPKTNENDETIPSFQDETLTNSDVILCRNNKPLVELAYNLLRRGIACKVEGREIGTGLANLARRWKVKQLDALKNRLETWQKREIQKAMAKNHEEVAAGIEDKYETMMVMIEKLQGEGKSTVEELVTFIFGLFGDTKEGETQKILTLSSVHKSKGREWNRVFILGRNKYMPSKWAIKDWQMQQERNLMYVAVTRSMNELVDIVVE